MLMKRDEAKRQIVAEWHPRAKSNNIVKANGIVALRFFGYLQREHSHLLQFRAQGDKWQWVHIWLREARLVSD